jgi:hypothetical protein
MKRLSLRASLTAWFLGLTTLLLGGFSATLYAALARALHGGVDAELQPEGIPSGLSRFLGSSSRTVKCRA